MTDNIISVIKKQTRRFWEHLKTFPIVWITVVVLLLSGTTNCLVQQLWLPTQMIIGVSLSIFVIILIRKPMSVVYGLIGTSGNIIIFFLNFFFVSFLFAGIYYTAFFSHAMISYDINQPYISFDMGRKNANITSHTSSHLTNINLDINVGDTVVVDHIINGIVTKDTMVYHIRPVASTTFLEKFDAPQYQKVTFWFVLRNTIMTSLIQEPTDFFASASTYNEAQSVDGLNTDKQKSALFSCILIFQILISWIFFGVFISLLYNKFRYES